MEIFHCRRGKKGTRFFTCLRFISFSFFLPFACRQNYCVPLWWIHVNSFYDLIIKRAPVHVSVLVCVCMYQYHRYAHRILNWLTSFTAYECIKQNVQVFHGNFGLPMRRKKEFKIDVSTNYYSERKRRHISFRPFILCTFFIHKY